MTEFLRIPCLLIGYFIGCFQSAYFVSKLIAGIDIRQHGSGNLGTSNVQRVLGNRAGALVFVCDVLKAVLAYFICALAFRALPLAGLYAGIGVLLGHNFPFFLKFKGGKGIASSIGLYLCLDWRVALPVIAVGLVLLVIFRYISLLSLVIVALFPVGLILARAPWEAVILCVLAAVMAYVLHRENIKRLFKGNERKLSLKRNKETKK
ncbi:MAG: glycerol-3-phosphate 1-O-acyltransferase PlsY [Firmicutes bacterium]|nr:glycerol-3-phosphate 1-O-acyltransferase PlsY [Bacillota bacterium]